MSKRDWRERWPVGTRVEWFNRIRRKWMTGSVLRHGGRSWLLAPNVVVATDDYPNSGAARVIESPRMLRRLPAVSTPEPEGGT